LKLLSLELENFKGCRYFRLETDGDNVDVFGDNETGKTTLFDAYLWLLFGKDSLGQSDFDIKTIVDGKPVHNLNHRVKGVWQLENGEKLELEAIYLEKWVTKRGNATAEFEGHTTKYAVNKVPIERESDYKAHVRKYIDEKTFRLLSDVRYFNVTLKWQERREMLLQLIGDITMDDVVTANPALADLPNILNGRSVDDHRKIIKGSRNEYGEKLKQLPARIDQLNKLITENDSAEKPKGNKDELNAKANALRDERARLKAGGEVANKTAELNTAEADLQTLLAQLRTEANAGHDAQSKVVRELREQLSEVDIQILTKTGERDTKLMAVDSINAALESLRAQFKEKSAITFVAEGIETDCAACGQPLPAERVAAAREKAEATFNIRKSEELEANKSAGKTKAQELASIRDAISKIDETLEELKAQKEALTEQIATENEKLQVLVDMPQADTSTDPRVTAANERIAAIQAEIDQLKESIEPRLENIHDEIFETTQAIDAITAYEAQIKATDTAQKQIEELKAEEKRIASEVERIDREWFLCEEFIRAKVSMLENRVNSKFEIVRFRLFEEQMNGGLQEVCEAMVGDVPYSSLNNAARINAGIDIINTLARHHRFAPPIFVDNAESVTRLLPADGQLIRLVVSSEDKKLRVVTVPTLQLVAPTN